MNSKVYKWCGVPQCGNTSIKTPYKLFVYVPHNKTIRNKWLKLARRDSKGILPSTHLYFCEDHFDLPNDMDNYMEYHLMGSVSVVRMKPGCMPTKFQCQPDIRKRMSDATERPYILKKHRRTLIEECEKDLKEISTKLVELEKMSCGSSVLFSTVNALSKEKVDNIRVITDEAVSIVPEVSIEIKQECEKSDKDTYKISSSSEPSKDIASTNVKPSPFEMVSIDKEIKKECDQADEDFYPDPSSSKYNVEIKIDIGDAITKDEIEDVVVEENTPSIDNLHRKCDACKGEVPKAAAGSTTDTASEGSDDEVLTAELRQLREEMRSTRRQMQSLSRTIERALLRVTACESRCETLEARVGLLESRLDLNGRGREQLV